MKNQEYYSSSVGSSLVGESVNSWLATTSDSLTTKDDVTEPGLGRYEENTSQEENSSQLPVIKEDFGHESSVCYLSDGHYWIDTDPLPLLCDEDHLDYKTPSRVSFSGAPIRQFSTHSKEDYDRRNEDVNPAAASADYELEKRLDMMEVFPVELFKGKEGLGLSVLGMGTGTDVGEEKLCIYIKNLTDGGAADRDGRMRVHDLIIEVNGVSLIGVNQAFAASVLRDVTGKVIFLLGRESHLEENEGIDFKKPVSCRIVLL